MPVLAPADGRVVEVTDDYADNPPGTNSDDANHLVIAIDVDRYVSMAHLQQGSVTVAVGDSVHRGSSSPRLGTTATPAHRICTSRSKTLPQVATPTALTPCCSATSTSPGAVPGRGATQAISAPATSSDHADRRVDPGWGLQARLGRTGQKSGNRHLCQFPDLRPLRRPMAGALNGTALRAPLAGQRCVTSCAQPPASGHSAASRRRLITVRSTTLFREPTTCLGLRIGRRRWTGLRRIRRALCVLPDLSWVLGQGCADRGGSVHDAVRGSF